MSENKEESKLLLVRVKKDDRTEFLGITAPDPKKPGKRKVIQRIIGSENKLPPSGEVTRVDLDQDKYKPGKRKP